MSELPQRIDWQAFKVIDGNTNQTANGSSCAIIDFSKEYKSVWLKIQLPRLFNVAYTEIYFRNEGTLDRSAGFSIYAYYDDTFNISSLDPNNIAYRHDPMSGCPASIQNITINRLVRQVVFTNNRPVGYKSVCPGHGSDVFTSIEICEIKVMGCDKGRYSAGCVNRCPDTCKSSHYDVFNGSCLQGCPNPNALTDDCIVCANGQYILNRECVNCSSYCKNYSLCNKLTGKCDNGCNNHWTGNFCQECSEYFYGRDCNTPCGHCRGNDPCDGVTGHCPNRCQNHWTGDRCDVCEDGFYNASCTAECGHCIKEEVCNKHNGTCVNGCSPNFLRPLCQEHGLTTTGVVALAITSTLLGISLLTIFFLLRHVLMNQTSRQRSDIPLPPNKDTSQTFTDLTATEDVSSYTTLGAREEESSYEAFGESSST